MIDLETALSSGQLPILIWTAVALGVLHTLLGPDHYVPFAMLATAQQWSHRRTMTITLLCAVGHVVSSTVIGAALIFAGIALSAWPESRWAHWHEMRGEVATWLLMGVGVAFIAWGTKQALRGRAHSHRHIHSDGTVHDHEHDHHGRHVHVHARENRVRRITPWVLSGIFVFGPCESLIPLMLASWAACGLGGTILVAGSFCMATILAVVASVFALLVGISRLPLGALDKWSTCIAGLSLVLCGAAIRWLGL